MANGESRLERWLDGEIKRARSPRGAAIIIAVVTTTLTVGSGLLMTIVDHKEFGSVGVGLWWAVQTVTTVGYGDHVPADVVGRSLAAIVMLLGIGFVTVITAAITSAFVAQAREDRPATPPSAQLTEIAERLDRIEKAVNARP
ncbi:MAG: potassium channel family protein [Candidatus Limnocylindrales bacterium]